MTYFSLNVAVALTLLAACMWGSWMQIIKHRKEYPIQGIIFLLYTFSLVLVGTITLILAPFLLPEGIIYTTANNIGIVVQILISGAFMAAGMHFTLEVMNKAGLLLATTITGAVGSILGIATAIFAEGIPERANALLLLAVITVVFIVAGQLCNIASAWRDRDFGRDQQSKTITGMVLIMILLSVIFINGWAYGTALGTASGFPPILTAFYMASGSFLGVLIVYGYRFTVKKTWKQVLCLSGFPKKPLLFCVIAAICHYGGNLLAIYSMPSLTATLSFMFGRVAGLVTIGWGFYYREFSGASSRTKWMLVAGLVTYFLALFLLGYYTYGG